MSNIHTYYSVCRGSSVIAEYQTLAGARSGIRSMRNRLNGRRMPYYGDSLDEVRWLALRTRKGIARQLRIVKMTMEILNV